MKLCKCLDCETIPPAAISTFETFEDNLPSFSPAGIITEEKQRTVYQALIQLRKQWCTNSCSPTAYMLVGEEVCTGLTNGAIDCIVKNFHNINTEEQLLELGIASHIYCKQLLLTLGSLK